VLRRLRGIALPVEHGVWGFWLEPALLGLLVAGSGAGVALVLAALAAVLLQTPLSLVLADARCPRRGPQPRSRGSPRTALAWRFVAVYGVALLATGWAALVLAGDLRVLWPVALAAPLVGVQFWFDARHRAREFVPETAGALAMGALAACVALAGGWALLPALGLWALLAARTVPTVLYVRARLRLERGERVDARPSLLAHGVAAGVAMAAAAFGTVPWLVPLPFVGLAARAARGLAADREPVTARVVGFRELGFGALLVVVLAVALRLAAGLGAWG